MCSQKCYSAENEVFKYVGTPQSTQLDGECMYYYFKESNSLFCIDEPLSSADSNLFMVHKASRSADGKFAKDFKPNSTIGFKD